MRLPVILVLVALTGACLYQPSGSVLSPSPSPNAVVVNDVFDSTYRVDGPTRHRVTRAYLDEMAYLLQSTVNRYTGVTSHHVAVIDFYSGDWRFWQRGAFDTQEPAIFVQGSRDVVSCSMYTCTHRETFGAMISDSLLRSRKSGFAIKFYGQRGRELVVTVDPMMSAEQIRVVDSIRAIARPRLHSGAGNPPVSPAASLRDGSAVHRCYWSTAQREVANGAPDAEYRSAL